MKQAATTILVILIASSTTAFAVDAPRGGEPPARFVVDTANLSDEELREAVEAGEGEIVRVDDALGFAVLELRDEEAFATTAERSPTPDVRGHGGASTPLAEAPVDPYLPAQWGPIELDAPQAWRIVPDTVEPTVAIVDSGIDTDHPDLARERIALGHDYVDGDDLPEDQHGHGTHVAGIVSAVRDNEQGIAGMTQAELYVTRVLNEDNAGWCSDFASGIREAVDAGADVVNFSVYCNDHHQSLADAVAYARDQGVVVVSITGNAQASAPEECIRHPGVHGAAIAVAALDPTLTPAYYSCQGEQAELAAPGSQVLSTVTGGAYSAYSGTSMAAPHVTATVAMLLDREPSLTVGEVRERLNQTARDLGPPGHDPLYGHGMVDPVAALTGMPVWAGDVSEPTRPPAG